MITLQTINNSIKECLSCDLSRQPRCTSKGNFNSGIIVMGEAAGRNEAIQGIPFVGAAGKLFDEIVEEVFNLPATQLFYFNNTIRCWPPNNSKPTEEQIKACNKFIQMELQAFVPELIITLGAYPLKTILNLTELPKMKDYVGKLHRVNSKIDCLACYHPAAHLYKPQLRIREHIKDTLIQHKSLILSIYKEKR